MADKELSKEEASLLARIDERTQFLVNQFGEIKKDLESKYVQKEEFAPVKNIVYGLVATILLGVIGAIIALVLK